MGRIRDALNYLREIPSLLKYMIPGIMTSVIMAIYMAGGASTAVTIIVVSGLVCYVIVTTKEIRVLNEKINLLAQVTSEQIGELAQATDEGINRLASNVDDSLHELTILFADGKYGPEEGEDA